jgi:hypothetical protein
MSQVVPLYQNVDNYVYKCSNLWITSGDFFFVKGLDNPAFPC